MSTRACSNPSDLWDRRSWLILLVSGVMTVALSSCRKTVTKYRPDGTPYDEKEDDWVGTLAAIIVVGIVIGGIAAAARRNRDDDDCECDPDVVRLLDREGKPIERG